jgi:hypothetical protein
MDKIAVNVGAPSRHVEQHAIGFDQLAAGLRCVLCRG